ncbi:transcription factor IIIB 90 kDa subunit [Elysia marginata]|uniref:Transcription factor IIIB 90 kDa subunit n=1 Tax=Elysia marginata TaxID=1093978 RepID=A0AAV4EYC0_9GAST|nr:transcription factor IIIB 90 kDa subunit [Elysia marginata]
MFALLSSIENGFTDSRQDLPQRLQELFQLSEHLSTLDGVVFYKDGIVIPPSLRPENQIGPNPLKWDKTGKVIEVRQLDQHVVKVDGSGQVTLQNRKLLRQYSHIPHTKSIAMVIPMPLVLMSTLPARPPSPTHYTFTIPPRLPTSNTRFQPQIADRPWFPEYPYTTTVYYHLSPQGPQLPHHEHHPQGL